MTAPRTSLTARSASVLRTLALSTASIIAVSGAGPAWAQLAPDDRAAGTNRPLQLAENSPFRDPDTIYLEADELISDEANNMLTAIGEAEGRYQDRTLRADRVDYDLTTGQVLASGNVVLIDATGDVQYADKLELSDELQAGTAANFTARLASGATTSARFVNRSEAGEVELFNATYTACEICKDSEGKADRPTWRLRARRVSQDADSRTIRYRDAVLDVFGIPVLYLPYFAHPDPSQGRASGLLIPTIGNSGSRGFTYVQPYHWAVDDYTELVVTPHIFSKVNPLLELSGRRKFHTGEINFESSVTRATLFDRNGDPLDDPTRFTDPTQAEKGPEISSHLFLDGYFTPNRNWSYGYTLMHQTDDTYLDRYGLSNQFETNGLIENENRINTSQAFLAGQGENYRLSILAAGFQSTFSQFREDPNTGLIRAIRDDDSILPIIAPQIEGEYYLSDPVLGGRPRLFGDITYLTRETGTDYGRASVGADYAKTWIAPMGLEVNSFLWGRFDRYDLETDSGDNIEFDRTIGHAGLDIRYPLLRNGETVDFIIEPRLQITQGFGDAKLGNFVDPLTQELLFEDGATPQLDPLLLFEANKADGFDFFESGRRIDVGATVKAQWDMGGQKSEVSVFGGQSFASDVDNAFTAGTGLDGDTSEYVAALEFNFGRYLSAQNSVRYDPDSDAITRLDSTVKLRTDYLRFTGRYFKLDLVQNIPNQPADSLNEGLSGNVTVGPVKGWSVGYSAVRDLDDKVTRSQRASLQFDDDCTRVELYYIKRNFDNDLVRDDDEFGIRLTLLTLGGAGNN